MLTEEALVLYAAAGGCMLLVLGVLELVAPTRGRRSGRRSPSRDPWRRARSTPAPPRDREAIGVRDEFESSPMEPPIERLLLSQAEALAPPSKAPFVPLPPDFEPAAAVGAGPSGAATDDEPEPECQPLAVRLPAEPAGVHHDEFETLPTLSLVDRCQALYEAGRHYDVITEAIAALDSSHSGALFMRAEDTARLWGIVALARHALGDRDGARAAFEDALAASPEEDRPKWQDRLATLILEVGQALLGQARSDTADAEERVTALHSALTWLGDGVATNPDDAALREALGEAQAALWPTYEQAVGELLQRQDYQVARRVIHQALGEDNCPAELAATFNEMLGGTYSGEVGQLTAEGIKKMQDGKEEEALATLNRAEAMLTAIPEGSLPPKRRHELERRLWWSYTKVGLRRVDGGLYEEALPPLLHALGYENVGPERKEETKVPLVRALEAIVTARSPLIQRMTADGDRDGALMLCEKLWSFLRTALERGLTKEELSVALTRTQGLFEKLGQPRS